MEPSAPQNLDLLLKTVSRALKTVKNKDFQVNRPKNGQFSK